MTEVLKIYCDGILLDVSEDTSLRLNRQLYDPSKFNSKDTTYSFSIDFPSTPANNRAFNYANHLNTSAKFSRRYGCVVYSGEIQIFEGTLLLQSYDAKDMVFSANLVSIKVNTVEDIFGDSTMYDLEWYEPYSGAPTINDVNADEDSEWYAPLVAYGVFEKSPYFSDETASDYTDIRLLDNTTLFYHETFYPSLNYLATVKRCFEQKGYELTGDIFQDPVLKNLFLSVSLPNEQIPVYNLANPKLGSVDLSIQWSNSGRTQVVLADALYQDLEFPYARLSPPQHGGGDPSNPIFHFKEIEFYNAFDQNQATVTENIASYLFDPGEQAIVIPASGAYRIDLEVSATLDTSWHNGKITGLTEFWTGQSTGKEEYNITYDQDILETCPIEVQLVRNVINGDNEIELIKSKNNYGYRQTTQSACTKEEWLTCYPMEALKQAKNPTKENPEKLGWTRGSSRGTPYNQQLGYIYPDNTISAYDPWVSNNFICGFSTYGGKNMAVIRNGHSWYRGMADSSKSFYEQDGYLWNTTSGSSATTYNENTYPDAPTSTVSINGNTLSGHIYCTVWLEKDDIVTLNVVHRAYESSATTTSYNNRYRSSLTARLKMDALTPRDYAFAREQNLGYLSPSQFDTDLRLGNFLSSGETMANFVNNFIKTFNLDYTQTGRVVTLNKGKINNSSNRYFIDLDGKGAWSDGNWQKIDFPRTMGVKYSIDKDEWGAWLEVPYEHRNDYNWADYIKGGYDIIELDPDATSSNEITNSLSYCWYDAFTLVEYEDDGETESGRTALLLPVIGKYKDLADGANYAESMKNDSLSLKQRCWFRGSSTGKDVKIQNEDETVTIYVPEGYYDDVENSYFSSGDTLLTRYFNVVNNATLDKLEIEVVLSPIEYQRISNGADVKFDDNLYQVSEISGYDVTGAEPTTLTLIQKQL